MMSLRLVLFLGACVLLSVTAQNQTKPDIEFVGFKVNREQQIKGRNIMLTATANMKLMGINDLIYCGFKNLNTTGSPPVETALAAAGIRFSQQRTMAKAKWFIKEKRSAGRIIWEFDPRGYALTEGRIYTYRMRNKVARDTIPDSVTWAFFCETKLTGQPNYYSFQESITVPLVMRRK
ncbi:hypothetical protein Naga_100198g8 [Nannochloropsis gaditana]|uniref:DUF4412 domain-containing protein n=1 Tax=Nannochloropsis gaditana TaxID=72520 RepID=W7T909_9STRA|nr:hypothetical protein Naga_100198g8 [Nannochloropsis gaditana]